MIRDHLMIREGAQSAVPLGSAIRISSSNLLTQNSDDFCANKLVGLALDGWFNGDRVECAMWLAPSQHSSLQELRLTANIV
jgi:hypothetical protein